MLFTYKQFLALAVVYLPIIVVVIICVQRDKIAKKKLREKKICEFVDAFLCPLRHEALSLREDVKKLTEELNREVGYRATYIYGGDFKKVFLKAVESPFGQIRIFEDLVRAWKVIEEMENDWRYGLSYQDSLRRALQLRGWLSELRCGFECFKLNIAYRWAQEYSSLFEQLSWAYMERSMGHEFSTGFRDDRKITSEDLIQEIHRLLHELDDAVSWSGFKKGEIVKLLDTANEFGRTYLRWFF